MNPLDGVLDALENVRANPLRSFLTMLGVIIGVFAVVALVSIGEGVKKFVAKEFSGLGTNILIVTPGAAQTSGAQALTRVCSGLGIDVYDLTTDQPLDLALFDLLNSRMRRGRTVSRRKGRK